MAERFTTQDALTLAVAMLPMKATKLDRELFGDAQAQVHRTAARIRADHATRQNLCPHCGESLERSNAQ